MNVFQKTSYKLEGLVHSYEPTETRHRDPRSSGVLRLHPDTAELKGNLLENQTLSDTLTDAVIDNIVI